MATDRELQLSRLWARLEGLRRRKARLEARAGGGGLARRQRYHPDPAGYTAYSHFPLLGGRTRRVQAGHLNDVRAALAERATLAGVAITLPPTVAETDSFVLGAESFEPWLLAARPAAEIIADSGCFYAFDAITLLNWAALDFAGAMNLAYGFGGGAVKIDDPANNLAWVGPWNPYHKVDGADPVTRNRFYRGYLNELIYLLAMLEFVRVTDHPSDLTLTIAASNMATGEVVVPFGSLGGAGTGSVTGGTPIKTFDLTGPVPHYWLDWENISVAAGGGNVGLSVTGDGQALDDPFAPYCYRRVSSAYCLPIYFPF